MYTLKNLKGLFLYLKHKLNKRYIWLLRNVRNAQTIVYTTVLITMKLFYEKIHFKK